VRYSNQDANVKSVTSSFVFLGPADLISAKGNKPIQMEWELRNKMQVGFFKDAKRAAGIS